MEYELVCRKPGGQPLPESVRGEFLAGAEVWAIADGGGDSGWATHTAGLNWARAAGSRTNTRHYGIRYR